MRVRRSEPRPTFIKVREPMPTDANDRSTVSIVSDMKWSLQQRHPGFFIQATTWEDGYVVFHMMKP